MFERRYNSGAMSGERGPTNSAPGVPIHLEEPGKRHPLFAYLRGRFVTGILVAFPLVVTLFFGRFLFGLMDRWADPISLQLFGRRVPGAGAALVVVLVFVLGVLAHNVIGRRVLNLGDRLFARIPVLRSIYVGAREVTRTFASDRTSGFRRVVLIPFPHEGVWAVAFVTAEFDETTPEGIRRSVAVFMPTTPNPTTGFFLVYPVATVRPTDLTVEEAFRIVISGGLVTTGKAKLFSRQAPPQEKT
jgi:uncharacterized membrane protein